MFYDFVSCASFCARKPVQSATSCGCLVDLSRPTEDLWIQPLVLTFLKSVLFFCLLQMYVTLVFRTKGTRLTKPTLCLVLLSLAVLVGVVRVTEHRNHWNDVLAGFVTGGAIAAFLVRGDWREVLEGW